MSWLDQLQTASFRDVKFQVDTVDVSAGDNVVLREYPFQDLPTVFRMGAAAEEIRLSAYVIGEDYLQQRDALRQALTGVGELVHPTAGTMKVAVNGKYSIREAPAAEGGMARFDLVFVRAEPRRYPVALVATRDDARAKAAAARAATADAAAAGWVLDGKPGWVAASALQRLRSSLDAAMAPVQAAARSLGQFNGVVVDGYQALAAELDELVRAPRQLADQVATLFELPGELTAAAARDLQAAFAWTFDVSQRVRAVDFEVIVVPPVGEGLVMYGTGNGAVLGADGSARAQLAVLAAASDQLVEGMATAAWVQALASIEPESYDEAMAMRATINAQVTRLLVRASEAPASGGQAASSWHDAMLGLLTAALEHLQRNSRDLVRLTTYTPQAWQPVWYVSYRLYGTADYADEIMTMNPHIQHPMLVPPGRPLRVVHHG